MRSPASSTVGPSASQVGYAPFQGQSRPLFCQFTGARLSAMSEHPCNESFMFAIGEPESSNEESEWTKVQRKRKAPRRVTYAPAFEIIPPANTVGGIAPDGYIMIDSGACDSACVPNAFDDPVDVTQRKRLYAINSTEIKVHGRQKAKVRVGNHMEHLAQFDFNVTDCSENVLSVSNIVDQGGSVSFTPKGAWISNHNGDRLDIARKNKRWYLPYQKT